ncbi:MULTISPECIES: hypothetical protein [unclassified Roseovarius]|uniref:hypothetical protein n=1 Tax=unclassified Roseovarius TaxID=2614913 RepID=UPI00273F11FF|nr:hypothetical protein [Roseovarius sp. MMSF_3350]
MNEALVMVLEDDPVITLGLEMELRHQGFDNLVLCNSVESATSEISLRIPKVAIVDFTIDDSNSSVCIAQRLVQNACRVVFVADFEADVRNLPKTPRDCEVIEKPFRDAEVVEKISLLLRSPETN